MAVSTQGDEQRGINISAVVRRFHAADDKARNERQKSMLLIYLAEFRAELLARIIEKSSHIIEKLKAAATIRGEK